VKNVVKQGSIRVLLIEDSPVDASCVADFLAQSKVTFELTWHTSLTAGLECLEHRPSFDVLLLDLTLPDSNGLDTFRKARATTTLLPIVVMTGLDDETMAVEAVQVGAQDYLVKGRVDGDRLGRALRYAIERKRSEIALHESEARFRKVFEEGPVGMALLDLRGRLLNVNEAFCRMLGRDGAELIGAHITDVTHPQDVADILRSLKRLYAGEVAVLHRQQRYVARDERLLWTNLTASVIRDAAGIPLYAIAIAENVTERKAAIEKLEDREMLLSQAQGIAHLGSWEWHVATDRMTWSDELYRIYGLDTDGFEPTFARYLSRIHPDDRERTSQCIDVALRDRRPFDIEQRIARPDGTTRFVRSQGHVVADAAGGVVRVIGACLDITEQKRVEGVLVLARDAALQSARLKSAFIANMSHEIRTPLNIILGYNAVIAQCFSELDTAGHATIVESVQRAGARLLNTIDGILDLSRIETGTFDVHPVPIELRAVIDKHVDDFRILAKEKGLTLSRVIEEPTAVVHCDEYCLSHALMNLLQNAIKFTSCGGVSVIVERDDANALSIAVRDTGIGIDDAYLPRLFERFSQQEGGYGRRFEGSGLGLALTKQYLQLNGACISVRSEPGKGSVFRIHFPKEAEESRRDRGRMIA
jgi:PAS domain S-box-containing protein